MDSHPALIDKPIHKNDENDAVHGAAGPSRKFANEGSDICQDERPRRSFPLIATTAASTSCPRALPTPLPTALFPGTPSARASGSDPNVMSALRLTVLIVRTSYVLAVGAAVVAPDVLSAGVLQKAHTARHNIMFPTVQGPLVLSAEATFVVLLVLLGTGIVATPFLYIWARGAAREGNVVAVDSDTEKAVDVKLAGPSTSRRHWQTVVTQGMRRLSSDGVEVEVEAGDIREGQESPVRVLQLPGKERSKAESLAQEIQASLSNLVEKTATNRTNSEDDAASSRYRTPDSGPNSPESVDTRSLEDSQRLRARPSEEFTQSEATDTTATPPWESPGIQCRVLVQAGIDEKMDISSNLVTAQATPPTDEK